MLIAKDLKKSFSDYNVINNINLTIEDGKFVGIVGESGSGKSTLLYLLSGLLKPNNGQIFLDDVDITKLDDKSLSKIRLKNFGFVFQMNNLLDGLNVLENIEVPLILSNKNPKSYHNTIFQLLDDLRLEGLSKKYIGELSGGQQQRVAIARALICEPKIIFADEPTGSLDSKNRDNIIELFNKINLERNISIIMVTHSEKTLKYCTKIIKICDGYIDEKNN